MTIIIGLSGKAGSGKDTFAQRLVEEHGFTRLAFADPLKEVLRKMDPVIGSLWDKPSFRVSETANPKDWPEYRHLMQSLGSAIRDIDPEFWVDALNNGLERIYREDMRVVVTDVRMENEHKFLKFVWRALMLHIERPGAGLDGALATHASETDMDSFNSHRVLNDGTIEDLWAKADLIAEALIDAERSANGTGSIA